MENFSSDSPQNTKLIMPYPKELKCRCILCDSPIERLYNTSKKTIYCLTATYDVRYDLVECTNPKCEMHGVPFNPAPRFDYSQRSYGRDVLEKIGEYSILSTTKLNPQQIAEILKREYRMKISSRTIARMCDDILILTSFQIYVNTQAVLARQKNVLIALDGQEPDEKRPALWNFTDSISGRVLMTRYLERVDHLILHACLLELQQMYPLQIVGFISDKQASIRKCLETFYPEIPHQYCTFHFSSNLWNHLEKYSNRIHTILQKTVKSLYINTVPAQIMINVPDQDEKISLRDLCAPFVKELKKVVKSKNQKFKLLSGIEEFERLSTYLKGFKNSVEKIPENDRFANIMQKTVQKLEEGLANTQDIYKDAAEGFLFFNNIHKYLWKDELERQDKIIALNQVFDAIWVRVLQLNPNAIKSERKSFLPSSKSVYWAVLAEWTRLWEQYSPGLFNYYQFPVAIKSNVDMEQKFSVEKQRFRSQSGKGQVGQMVRARGQYILRLLYCKQEEIDFHSIIGNARAHLSYLKHELQQNIQESSKYNTQNQKIEDIYKALFIRMYYMIPTKMEVV